MKKRLFSSVIIGILSISSAQAFDDNKKGFLVSLGGGLSNVNTKVSLGNLGANESSFGLASSFKLGYGFNEQFMLYYVNDVSWYGYENDPNKDTYATGLTGIGASYFFDKNKPYYILGGVGVGTITNVSKSVQTRGNSFMIGAGYEAVKHLQVEASYVKSNFEESNVKANINTVKMTLNYMWY